MRHGICLLLSVWVSAADTTPARPVETPPPPFVVRVLALGHDPERRYKKIGGGAGSPGGLLIMEEPDAKELPPTEIYFRPPPPPAPLPANSPLLKAFTRVACATNLNSVQQVTLPAEIPVDAKLIIEKEVPAPPAAAGAKGPPEKAYDEIGVLQRKSETTSSLVVLYNPVGAKTWENVRPTVIDTSETVLPVGSILVYNLCRENLSATIGGNNGVLASGQSALVRPAVGTDSLFGLRLLLAKSGEDVQLIDSVRGLPPGSRAFLIIHPVPISRNSREADFVLFVIPADPKPEPVVAPVITPKPVR